MKIRFYNAKIMLKDKKGYELANGELWTKDNIISYIGKGKETEDIFDREIDLEENLIMPGFKNAHIHSPMTFARSYADDMALNSWLMDRIFPMEAKLKEEYVYYFSILAMMECLTSGITSGFDMYFYQDAIARASVDIGYRTVLCGTVNDFVESAEELEENYMKFNNYNEIITYELGFHGEYTTSRGLLKKIAKISHRRQAPVYSHNSETKKEVKDCISRNGKTPMKYLNDLEMFEYGGGGFHCIHLTDDDINIVKEKNIHIITNPASNCKLASGIAPLERYLKEGINVGIGTDGTGSNNSLDMFKEMYIATALQKVSLEDASALEAKKVLNMAIESGAKAMRIEETSELKEGKLADMIVIDLSMPNMQPLNNTAENLVYSGSKINVKMTMINGKILYENGKFDIGLDPKEIYSKVNEIMKKIKI